MRNTKTDYVSCPSCGRTLFDLQEVTASIQQKTGHLPGVSIAIMGCIVNGPGEMADADFGYVGTVPGKIDLYVGKEVVRKNVDMVTAPDALWTSSRTTVAGWSPAWTRRERRRRKSLWSREGATLATEREGRLFAQFFPFLSGLLVEAGR